MALKIYNLGFVYIISSRGRVNLNLLLPLGLDVNSALMY